MIGSKGSDGGSPSGGGQSNRRNPKRRRTILNLGAPFVQVDDFIEQADDAVTIGYRVLEDVVKEIQRGYQIAKDYNAARKAFQEGRGDEPAVPWEDLVQSAQTFQDITFAASKDSTDVLFASVESGMKAAKSIAETVARSRRDADTKTPTLAGPVFDELLVVQATAGSLAPELKVPIRHRGLTRLRIHAQVRSPLLELLPPGGKVSPQTLVVQEVRFAPQGSVDGKADEETSELTVRVGTISKDQNPGAYEGLITASNFALLIGRLRVEVAAPAPAPAPGPAASQKPASPQSRPPQSSSPTSRPPQASSRKSTSSRLPRSSSPKPTSPPSRSAKGRQRPKRRRTA